MRKFVPVFMLALLLAACLPTPSEGPEARVTRVIDGDTIDVSLNGSSYRVRYIGIDTPERDEACYDDASAANRELVEGRVVTLMRDVSDTDKYGRLLRYVYVGSEMVNETLVRDGWAAAVEYPPDTAYLQMLRRLEREARSANIGCYPTGVFD